jgi:quinol monooxygenase YgiN
MKTSASDVDRVVEVVSTFVRKAQEEAGVISLSYFANDANDTIIVHEHYRDAAGMLAHLGGMDAEAVGALVSLITIESMLVAGTVTEELRAALAPFGNVTYLRPLVSTDE